MIFCSIKRRIITLVLTLVLYFSSEAQISNSQLFSKQLSITTENDYYLFQGKDAYYTNGIILNYSKIHKARKNTFIKQIDQFEIGQKIYTAFSRKIYHPDQIDRPITGYLYAKFLRSDFMKHNQLFQWGVSAGTIGNAALGEQMQDGFHRLIHVDPSIWGWIWNYQLKTEPGINFHGLYAKGLLKSETSFFQLTPVSNATLGTTFTNISQGLFFQFGKLKPISQSAYFNAALSEVRTSHIKESELFFYYLPELEYQLYNATVQGGLFRKDKGPIISTLKPLVFTQQLGALYSFSRYTLSLGVVFESKEASSQRFNHTYGSIQGSYRFH